MKLHPSLKILNNPKRNEDIAEVYCDDCKGVFRTKRINLRKSSEKK